MTTTTTTPDSGNDSNQSEQREFVIDANYQFFIIAVTVLQLVNSLLIFLIPEPQRSVVVVFFVLFSLVLIGDAIRRLLRLRRHPLIRGRKTSLLLLVGSLPVPFLILVRLAASYSFLRILQSTDFTTLSNVVIKKRAQSTLLIAIFAAMVILEMGSALVLAAEIKSPAANIVDANDAIWWALVTVATVGYGDQYPVTTAGRLIGVMIMVAGVGLFSVLTSYFAHWFLKPAPGEPDDATKTISHNEYNALLSKLETLTGLVEQQAAGQPANGPPLVSAPADVPNNSSE